VSIHRVRLVYSEGGAASFNGWLETWLTNMQPWAERENGVPSTVEPYPDSDWPAHYRGDLTFDWSEDKAIIEDQLNGYLGPYCDWGIVGYHICDHDEADRDGCSWESVTEHGIIPEGVRL
jgi:hypothetical protein